jgi:hypothetical protein
LLEADDKLILKDVQFSILNPHYLYVLLSDGRFFLNNILEEMRLGGSE